MKPNKTIAIKNFLMASTHLDLASLYNHDMEVQVNVAQGSGTRVDGDFKGKQWHGWTDGFQVWKPIRIPLKANSEPEYIDSPINFDLAIHAMGIGMTGWDWKSKVSRWVGFDFDGIVGHSERHAKKLSDAELVELQENVKNIDWVTLRLSKSGHGLHLYIFLNAVETENHTEHAALARAILSKLSALVGYDFDSKVDVQGGNLWVWHREMDLVNGLRLLKQGTILTDFPINWKDHIKVAKGLRKRAIPTFIDEQTEINKDTGDNFADLTSQRIRVKLTAEHMNLIKWIDDNYPNCSWWDSDHWMYITHTSILKEAHESLNMRGVFETIAKGTEKGNDWNIFMFPMVDGAWVVRRYAPGAAEHPSWDQDAAGWTRCFYNREPDLATACRAHEGLEDPSGGYVFQSAEQAQKAALLLGADLKVPNYLLYRETKLKEHRSGRIIAEIQQESKDNPLPTWLIKRSKFIKLFDVKMIDSSETETAILDDEIRHLITQSGDDYGWVIKSDNIWHSEPFQHVKSFLKSKNLTQTEVENVLGSSISRHWTLVNLPFQESEPGNRQWNRGAPQLRYTPTLDKDKLSYPTWLRILKHLGQGLDEVVNNHAWCKSNGILTGADYLKCWIASVFKEPHESLPYLFFFGNQNSGKSIFHEALELLVTAGVVRADTALTSNSNFNGELEHSIICVIEETDLRKNKNAYEKVKDWVTSKMLPIHKKTKQPYTIPNTCHFVQMANSHQACPIFPGDTRISMISVPDLMPEEIIPKKILMPQLIKEAPDFLAEILSLELPVSPDRLNIPALATEEKLAAEKANQTLLEMFIDENCHYVPGEMIKFSDFYDKFISWIDPNYIKDWTKIRVGKEIPPKFPKGRLPSTGQFWLGNISFKPKNPEESIMDKLVLKGGFIVSAIKNTETVQKIKENGRLEVSKSDN